MPIYAYKCEACGRETEALQKISDAPLVSCPACHRDTLKKMLTAPAFRLSGSGWYETDFKKDNRRNLAGEKDAAASGSSSAEGSSSSGGDSGSKESASSPAPTSAGESG